MKSKCCRLEMTILIAIRRFLNQICCSCCIAMERIVFEVILCHVQLHLFNKIHFDDIYMRQQYIWYLKM